MKRLLSVSHRSKRGTTEKGAVLMVVLIVMIALLGLGMTGLFLTSSSIQMNTNINLRNQALVVAEAGIERARGILNNRTPGWIPAVPALLAGSVPSYDEVPSSPADCQGSARGAILVDSITPSCTGSPLPPSCILRKVSYPSLDRASDLPSSAGPVARATMGTYTVFIRQDQADCRMGNYTCDNAPVPTGVDGGTGGAGGSSGVTTCTAPTNAPVPNGAVVIRSEGFVSDGTPGDSERGTRVVLEVTMTPAQGGQRANNTPMSALCAAGASGCDDNTSVQSGIVVKSNAPQVPPPPGTGGVPETGGAPGSGGAPGTGGVTGAGGTGVPPGSGGVTTGGTTGGGTGGVPGTGGTGTGGTGGSGTGGSTCQPSGCPLIATMGVIGTQASTNFKKWLADHSGNCFLQALPVESQPITDAMLAPYRIVIVMDVGHSQKNLDDFWALAGTDYWNAWLQYIKPNNPVRQFGYWEGQAVKRWVTNGGGLVVINGYSDALATNANFNAILQPLDLTYYSPPCGLNTGCTTSILDQSAKGVFNITSFTPHPINTGMTIWYMMGYWPISGYPATFGFPTTPSGYTVWARQGTNIVAVARNYVNGRVVVMADEWLTYDYTMASASLGPSTYAFWNNSVAWLGQCH